MSQEENNPVLDYATQRFATAPVEQASETEMVTDNTTETTDAPVSTEMVEQNTTDVSTESQPSQEAPVVDYSTILAEVSEGLFTDLDSFKQALPKVKEYDSLVSAKTELEEKLKVNPFANDLSKAINDMASAGKSIDEIETFIKLNKTDVDNLSAVDAKVMRLVNDGYSLDAAKAKVELDFPIEDYEEGSPKRLVLEEELRISSLEDRKVLNELKKDLTAVDNSAKIQAEQQAEQERLQKIANEAEQTKLIKASVPKIAETIKGLGEVNLNGKDGEEAVKLSFDYNSEYKQGLKDSLENFFLDSKMPVTAENVTLAERYVKADYLERNFQQLAQQIFKHAEAVTTEKVVNQYENRSGLAPEQTNVIVDETKQQQYDFLQRVARGR